MIARAAVLGVLMAISASASAQCITSFGYCGTYVGTLNFQIAGPLSADTVYGAAQGWHDACVTYGYGGMGANFPQVSVGTGDIIIDVTMLRGRSSSESGSCGNAAVMRTSSGEIVGGSIRLWEQDSNGVQCPVQQVLMHEMGHIFGLNQATSSACSGTIMGSQAYNTTPTFPAETCSTLDDNWYTTYEWARDTQDASDESNCGAYGCSPIVLDVTGNGITLTGVDRPVLFDIDADGARERIAWTDAAAGTVLLALDRNGNSLVDDASELFGNHTPSSRATAANGFDALAEFDNNRDGWIDASDPVWPQLLLWADRNHNGICFVSELTRISTTNIVRLGLRYQTIGRTDASGNKLRYQGTLIRRNDRGRLSRDAYYDVLLLPAR